MEYKCKVQYLESTGTQYIDTGVKPDYANGDRTEISFYRASYTGFQPCLFGCRENTSINGFYVLPAVMSANGPSARTEYQWHSTTKDYTIAVDDVNIMVDGSILATMSQRVTCTVNMYLFALNNYGTGTYGIYPGMRLYDWKYWRNGVLAQHFIPVLDLNNVPCLYDTVSGQLFYNKGTGQFLYGATLGPAIPAIPFLMRPLGRIAATYPRRLQYLASTGTQYIDTGIAPDFANGDSVEIRFYRAELNNAYGTMFGSRTAQVRNGIYLISDERAGSSPFRYIVCDSTGYIQPQMFTVNSWHEDIKMIVNNGSVTTVSEHYKGTYTFTQQVTSEYSVYLFALNSGGTMAFSYPGMKLYDWKYYRNGVLAQHLIPAMDENDVPCMFDTITGTYYYNAGTGTFNYA